MFTRSRRESDSTISFPRFTPVAPIPRKTIKRYESLAPAGAAEVWRRFGTGIVGDVFVVITFRLGVIEMSPRGVDLESSPLGCRTSSC